MSVRQIPVKALFFMLGNSDPSRRLATYLLGHSLLPGVTDSRGVNTRCVLCPGYRWVY